MLPGKIETKTSKSYDVPKEQLNYISQDDEPPLLAVHHSTVINQLFLGVFLPRSTLVVQALSR